MPRKERNEAQDWVGLCDRIRLGLKEPRGCSEEMGKSPSLHSCEAIALEWAGDTGSLDSGSS